MAIVQVELPAQNVWPEWDPAIPGTGLGANRHGGPDCLSNHDPDQYVRVYPSQFGFYVGAVESVSAPGYAVTSGEATGFGLFDLPAGATLIDCRFIMEGQFLGDEEIPDGWLGPLELDPPLQRWPLLSIEYSGLGAFPVFGYGLNTFNPVGTPIDHLLDGSDYVINGIGSPDTGTFGLCPIVHNLEPYWPNSGSLYPIHVWYLAILITYEIGGQAPPRRLHPRDDRRLFPPPTTRQNSTRLTGSW